MGREVEKGRDVENLIPEELSLEEAPVKWVLNVNDLPEGGLAGEKRADPQELRLLTRMLAGEEAGGEETMLEVRFFSCRYEIGLLKDQPPGKSGGRAAGELRGRFRLYAELRQTCVVTLDPIDMFVDEEFSQTFTSTGRSQVQDAFLFGEVEDPFAEEPPIRMDRGKIALGPLVCQYLSMAVDPNPRKAGAEFSQAALAEVTPNVRTAEKQQGQRENSPFGVLEKLRREK